MASKTVVNPITPATPEITGSAVFVTYSLALKVDDDTQVVAAVETVLKRIEDGLRYPDAYAMPDPVIVEFFKTHKTLDDVPVEARAGYLAQFKNYLLQIPEFCGLESAQVLILDQDKSVAKEYSYSYTVYSELQDDPLFDKLANSNSICVTTNDVLGRLVELLQREYDNIFAVFVAKPVEFAKLVHRGVLTQVNNDVRKINNLMKFERSYIHIFDHALSKFLYITDWDGDLSPDVLCNELSLKIVPEEFCNDATLDMLCLAELFFLCARLWPAYNCDKFIPAILSFLVAQKEVHTELADKLARVDAELIAHYAAKDSKVIKNTKNKSTKNKSNVSRKARSTKHKDKAARR